MTTLIIVAKIISGMLAITFFYFLTSTNTEFDVFVYKMQRYAFAFKVFFGAILIFSILSFIPFEKVFNNISTTLKPIEKGVSGTVDKKKFYGIWELEGYTHTVTFYDNRKVLLNYGKSKTSGTWTINGNKLLITTDHSDETDTYLISQITEKNYKITNLKDKTVYEGKKVK